MIRNASIAALLISPILLAGCAGTPTSFPGSSKADSVLQHDIYQAIGQLELAYAGEYRPEVVDTKYLRTTGNVSKEQWTIKRGKERVKYDVEVVPSPQGGSDLKIGLADPNQVGLLKH